MTTNHHGNTGREFTHARRKRKHFVGFERMHGGDAHQSRTRLSHVVLERTAEAQVSQGDVVAPGFKRGRDVLHAERLYSEEGAQAETLVSRYWPEQQDVHAERRA